MLMDWGIGFVPMMRGVLKAIGILKIREFISKEVERWLYSLDVVEDVPVLRHLQACTNIVLVSTSSKAAVLVK